LHDDRVSKLIEPNKLRILYPRRPCADKKNTACQEPDPPQNDYPNGWTGPADAMHIDIKIPSEHTINGERFDAEMQAFYLHVLRKRMPTQSVMIRAIDGGFNYYFQEAIDAFDAVYRQNQARCAIHQRRERRQLLSFERKLGVAAAAAAAAAAATADSSVKGTVGGGHAASWADFSTDLDNPDYEDMQRDAQRRLQMTVWDPQHEKLVPTLYFYRYDGSLTEPPCGEWVSWFIADKPMIISLEQLERLKTILFLNVNDKCQRTSVQYDHSVARPIQDTAGRPVWLCTPDDFVADPVV
jgi:carbonic anhydrase